MELEGDDPLNMVEGFQTVEDAAEALREMRETQMGGVEATVEEQSELEAALEGDEVAVPAAADGGGGEGGGGGGGGDGAGTSAAAWAAATAWAAAAERMLSWRSSAHLISGCGSMT